MLWCAMPMPPPDPFDLHGPAVPETPVVLAVPHAGRAYPATLLAMLRVPLARLAALEDRCVDHVAIAARQHETLLVARTPRAWIDLNRDEADRDPRIDAGAVRGSPSMKVRSGLGLVPRRIEGCDDIWRRRLSGAEVDARIAESHRPYHAMLAALLERARARFGVAVLLDVHSMPPLGAGNGPQIVIGDRFGQSADARLSSAIEAVGHRAGLRIAHNVPYAGAHILQRHADPARNIHALQLEIDRRLYLDAALAAPGAGLAATAMLVRAMAATLERIATGGA